MRFFTRGMIGLFLMAVTLGLLSLAAMLVVGALRAQSGGDGPGGAPRERVFSANVVLVTPADVQPELTAFGEIRSRRTLELRAPRAGRIVWLDPDFSDGSAVKAGQVLLRLDASEATAALELARADLGAAEAEKRDAESAVILAQDDLAAAEAQAVLRTQALDRQRDLEARDLGSAAAVETAELAASAAGQAVLSRRQALALAEARVNDASTALTRQAITLAEAERALRDTTISAEFDGVLSGVSVVEGGLLGSNERLADLIDAGDLEVSFPVSTAQFLRLIDADGALSAAPVHIGLDVLGAEIATTGRLTRVAAAAGEGQSGRLVYAALDAAPGFRPGDFVTVSVTEPVLENAAVLPGAAVNAGGQVLVRGTEDRLEEVSVEVLRQQGNDVIVAAGPLAGREVVAERSPLLGAGIRIKPLRAGVAAAPAPEPELVDLTPERRAELVAYVEANTRMPADAKARVLEQLAQDRVPAEVIARLEQRMGG